MRFDRIIYIIPFCFFTVLSICSQTITGFELIDAATETDIGALSDDSTIDLAITGSELNVRAEVSGSVGSIRFSYDNNPNFQTENIAPYAFAGDTNGDYASWTPQIGEHTITATAYAAVNAMGAVLSTMTVNFTVVDDSNGGGGPIDLPDDPGTGEMALSGELKKWHKVTLSFDGPAYSENEIELNPFLDYRLEATFTNGSKTYRVPGYFAADGDAAESSATTGNVWRIHFSPDEVGTWSYSVSFRIGEGIAISTNPIAGDAVPPIDGTSGTFMIGPSDKIAPDNRARGRLQYVDERYLRYAETGEYFLKGGADAPENFLAYEDIDNTPNIGDRRKSWAPHADDWNPGDPSWQNGKGTEIIGAVNYLASEGLNVFSFLTMNIQGDDRNVFPYVDAGDRLRFDCSKLDQWEIIFEHADQLGMYLHFKTQETENDQLLDGGAVGTERRLYYRELLARFGHHLALNWNMGEENTQTPAQRIAMAQWFADNDPYQHHRVIHTYPNQIQSVYSGLVGNQSEYTGASVQTGWNSVHARTLDWVENAQQTGKPWVVANDEQGNANTGVPPDPGYPGYNGSNPDLHGIRKEVLWGNLMAGGAGVEYYFGYNLPDSDLTLQNYRSRDLSWDYVRYALEFFRELPIETMQPNDNLVDDGWCLARENQVYVVYLKNGGSTTLQIDQAGDYTIRWYNPRTGELQMGSLENVSGPGAVELGDPPADPDEDWAILITNNEEPPADCGSLLTLYSRDFPYQDSDFYLDNFIGMDILAINPDQYQSAEVTQTFHGESCLYDLTFHGVGESDGQSIFRLYINDDFMGEIVLPLSSQDWEIGPAYNATFPNILLNDGDEIKVYGEVGTDGQEFSRARWLKIDLEPVQTSGSCPAKWEERNGLVVIEMENNTLTDSWDQTSEVGNFTGEGYIQWSGSQNFGSTGNGVLVYPVSISNPGTYIFDWRSGIANGNDGTEHNDSWLKIEADNFYAVRNQNGSQLKPWPACNNDPDYGCPNGSSLNGFFKVYMNTVNGWTWAASTSDNDAHAIYATFDDPGVYDIEVNARSSFHRIDRMILYQPGLISQGAARQIGNEETLCEGATD
ncbi:MAG: DUF5060 domain-containing protein, partial [Bacteroidota bacterium]